MDRRRCVVRDESDSLVAFLDAGLEDVIALFEEFNHGTHGRAGRFDLVQIQAINLRVEDAVRLVTRIVSQLAHKGGAGQAGGRGSEA